MVGRLPVIEQVIELGIEMFRRRIPWLREKVIDISLIDGTDRGGGVRVGGKQRPLRIGKKARRFLQKLTPSM
jgi:hypothetical protein